MKVVAPFSVIRSPLPVSSLLMETEAFSSSFCESFFRRRAWAAIREQDFCPGTIVIYT